jgi:hypothetical protein
MPISATFAADFSSFQTAVAQAETSLRSFEAGAGRTETALNKVTDSLSGVKIVQQATLAAEAVDRVGGVSALTTRELERLGATAQEAVEKMQALGIDVPEKIQAIADASHHAQQETGGWAQALDVAKGALGALGIATSLEALVAFGKEIVHNATSLQFTAAMLGESTAAIERQRFAIEQSGGSFEALSAAITFMNRNLEDETPKATHALEGLGLSLKSLQQASPEVAFNTIVEAIRKLPDPMQQSAAALDIFGRGAREILPAIKAGFEDVGKAAPIMADGSVEALARMDKAWKAFSTDAKVAVGEALGAVTGDTDSIIVSLGRLGNFIPLIGGYLTDYSKAIVETANASQTLAVVQGVSARSIEEMALKGKEAAPSLSYLNALLEIRTRETKEQADADAKAAEANEKYQTELGVYNEVLGRMTILASGAGQTTGEWAKSLLLAGASMSDVKSVTGLASGELEQFKKAIEASAAATRQATKDQETWAKGTAENYALAERLTDDYATEEAKMSHNALDAKLRDNQRWLDDETTKLLRSKGNQDSYYAALDALRARKIQKDEAALVEEQRKETQARDANLVLWDTYFVDEAKLHKSHVMDAELQQVKDGLQQQLDALDRSKPEWENQYDALVAIAGVRQAQIAQNYHDKAVQPMIDDGVKLLDAALHGWDDFKSALEGVWAEILHTFEEKVVKAIVDDWLGALAKMAEAGIAAEASSWWQALLGFFGLGGGGGDQIDVPPGLPPNLTGPGTHPGPPRNAATGGLITASGIERFDAGGMVSPWQPEGTDTVPAMLTPGERVLSVSDTKNYDAARLGTSVGSGSSVYVSFHVSAVDAKSVKDFFHDHARELSEQVARYATDRRLTVRQ